MKSLLAIVIALLLAVTAFAAIDLPPITGRINDYAFILSDETQLKLEQQLKQHEVSTSNQVVILTLPSLQGQQIEVVANELFNTLQLGQREKNNGVLVLIVPAERKMRIEVGYGLEPTLTDAHCSRIIRNEMAPHFKKEAYDEGVIAGVDAILGAIAGTYAAEDPGFWESLTLHEGLAFPENILAGAFVMSILLVFTSLAIFAEGFGSWFLFVFLLFFYLTFPFAIFGSGIGFFIVAVYTGTFAGSKIWFRTPGGKAYLKRLADRRRTGTGAYATSRSSSGRSSYRSSSRSSFSGGGGRSGGGGSSGSW